MPLPLFFPSWAEAPTAVFWSRYLSQVWVKSHLSESNLSKKGPPKCAYSRHILFCDKSAMLFHKSMEKKNSDNPFLTLSCSYLFHSMKGLITVSRAFVFQNEGIQPFLSQINTFGKWLRLSAKSLLSKTEKTQISEQTQIIWVRWSLWFKSDVPLEEEKVKNTALKGVLFRDLGLCSEC